MVDFKDKVLVFLASLSLLLFPFFTLVAETVLSLWRTTQIPTGVLSNMMLILRSLDLSEKWALVWENLQDTYHAWLF